MTAKKVKAEVPDEKLTKEEKAVVADEKAASARLYKMEREIAKARAWAEDEPWDDEDEDEPKN